MSFGKQVRRWREEAGLAAVALEKRIGKSGAYVSRVEDGTFPPPDKATCDAMGEVFAEHLSIERGAVWDAAVWERLDRLDPDVAAFVRARTTETEPKGRRGRLLRAIDRLQERIPGRDPMGALTWAIDAVLTENAEGDADLKRGEKPLSRDGALNFAAVLRELADLPEVAQQHAWARFLEMLVGSRFVHEPSGTSGLDRRERVRRRHGKDADAGTHWDAHEVREDPEWWT